MKKGDWFVIVLLLISPILINYIVLGQSFGITVNGSIDGWLGFYGAFVGAIIPMFLWFRIFRDVVSGLRPYRVLEKRN